MRILIFILPILLLTGPDITAQPIGHVQATADRRIAAQWLQNSRQAKDQNRLDETRSYAQKAIDAFTTLDEPDSLGESIVMLWSAMSLSDAPYPDRIPLLEQAAAAFERAGNRRRTADCLKELGNLQELTANYSACILSLQKSLRLYQSINHPALQGIYDLLCDLSVSLEDYDEGVRYGLLAVRAIEHTRDTSPSTCAYYNHLGMAYFGLQDYPKADQYFTRSLEIARKYEDSSGINILTFNIVRLYIQWERPRQALLMLMALQARYPAKFATDRFNTDVALLRIYEKMGPAGKAAEYCGAVEKAIDRKDIAPFKRAIGYLNLVNHYFNLHDYEKAGTHLAAYSQLIREMKSPRYIQNDLLWHFRIDSARGDFIDAIRYYQRYKTRGDTILNEAKSRQIEQYNALYESEKKDRSILLLQQESQTQQNQLRQEVVFRRFTLGGIIGLMIIVGLLYHTVRTKQRTNRMLESQRSEIDRKNYSLQQLVVEKDWLVKEIHHRVKNNLHMVVGLLASQAEYLKGAEACEAITESQHRIHAMSLIHQKLYNTENLSSIEMPQYVHELVDYLESSFDTGGRIRFTLDIAKVSFPLSHSIPVGLILNESITNAIKYAFPGGRKGLIAIILQQQPDDHEPGRRPPPGEPQHCFRLIIRDDGIGIPADYRRHSSLGIALIDGLCKDIRGNLSIANQNGTVISLTFPIALAAMKN